MPNSQFIYWYFSSHLSGPLSILCIVKSRIINFFNRGKFTGIYLNITKIFNHSRSHRLSLICNHHLTVRLKTTVTLCWLQLITTCSSAHVALFFSSCENIFCILNIINQIIKYFLGPSRFCCTYLLLVNMDVKVNIDIGYLGCNRWYKWMSG